MRILLNWNCFLSLGEEELAKKSLLSLPRNSIDSWSKCKDAFIRKYYPHAKIISLRSSIMNFKQSDNQHVAQAWEIMKSLVKNCPTHGLTAWMIIQTFYAGLIFLKGTFLIQHLEVPLYPSLWVLQQSFLMIWWLIILNGTRLAKVRR